MSRWIELFAAAVDGIRAHAFRSVLTTLGIVIGVASVIAVVSIVQGLSHSITANFADLGSNSLTVHSHTSFSDQLQGKINRIGLLDYEKLRHQLEEASDISPVLPVFGQFGTDVRAGSQKAFTRVIASSPVYQDTRKNYPLQGRFITDEDERHRRRVCVVGPKVAENIAGDRPLLGRFIEIRGEWFKVVGVMEARGEMFGLSQDDYIIIPFSTGLLLLPPDQPPDISVTFNVPEIDRIDTVRKRITGLLRQQHGLKPGEPDDFKIDTPEQLMKSFSGVLDTATLVFTAIVGISLFVGGIGVMNIMLVSVTERTREIGILKALGARRSDIMLQFLLEAMLLSALGGMVGLLIGWIGGWLVSSLVPALPSAVVPAWAAALALGSSSLVGVVFGIVPAARAASLDPIAALRSE